MSILKKTGIGFLITLFFILSATKVHATNESGEKIDVKEIVLGHMSDAYDWHITTWGEHHISIPLPVIVKGKTSGWHIFSSSRLAHGQSYEGFFIEKDSGKIHEQINETTTTRPLDLSIIKLSTGADKYKPYAPFLLTAFFFIFITNLLGLLPIFPGGANVTGNITITFFLAICTMLIVNIFGNKEYWKEIFWPEVPAWLKVPVPIMPVIELFGIFTKPLALMVRLFANMMGGHAIILSLTCVIFITCQLGTAIGAPLSFASFIVMIFMNCLELLVAFVQAYVFTMLSAVFIGLAHPAHHK